MEHFFARSGAPGSPDNTLDSFNDLLRSLGEQNRTCAPSPTYMKLIDSAAEIIYDPHSMGNLAALEHKYDCSIHSEQDAYMFAKKALEDIGDPYTEVMTPAEVAEMKRAIEGVTAGVGIIFKNRGNTESGGIKVTDVVKGSPAEVSGIKSGDTLTAVDGKDITHLSTEEAVKLVRGDAGTSVDLTFDRNGEKIQKHVTRANIQIPEVEEKDLGNGMVYIRLNDFMQKDAVESMRKTMEDHKNASGFIIDVRNNGGGMVDSALSISEMFVKSGKLVTIQQRTPGDPSHPEYETQTYRVLPLVPLEVSTGSRIFDFGVRSRETDYAQNKPVVILTNENTASAAEIFTGAVRDDNPNATIVGEHTFGKGIGQRVLDNMPDGTWLKVTTLKYFTPGRVWPGDGNNNRPGIKADIVVSNPEDAELGTPSDAQLNAAINVLSRKIKPH